MEETNLGNNSFSSKSPEFAEHEGIDIGSTEYEHICSKPEVPQCPAEAVSDPGKLDPQKVSAKNSRRLSWYGKKIATRNKGKRYLLRSSFGSSRVLRSTSKAAHVTPPPLENISVNHVKERSKRRIKTRKLLNDEFSRIRRSVRYLLHRMSYEQSLIDAYAGEGWKGQSSEKIKPEMELQRAKSEILRCKLKIRNIFQQLDSSISEGKLDDSLFDTEGEICSEDIFCAKCSSMDVSADNDIILCDGICDRGFHQRCLDPPLLKDDIPPGDEGWLCPGCDCKLDCLDVINETQDTDLSIEDEWEKVFPEAAAFASKNAQDDDLELPSDESEDHDYDPDHLEADEEAEEGSSSDESDFTSASEDSDALNHDLQDQTFGFPSDDSEDIDYDPDKPNCDEMAAEGPLSSDESDFTSDTDDLNVPDNHISEADETPVFPVSTYPSSFSHSGKESYVGITNKSSVNSVLYSLESEPGQESTVPVSGKRQRERLDYKKLYDEAYRNELSDSSDDKEWTEASTPKNLKEDATKEEAEGLTKNHVKQRSSKRVKGKEDLQNTIMHAVCAGMKEKENSEKAKDHGEAQSGLVNHSVGKLHPDVAQPSSSEKTPGSSRKYEAAGFQKLQESFRKNQYPCRETKESLARELGMTAQQVSKWFENARHKFRASAKEVSPAGPSSVSATSCGGKSNDNINVQEEVGSGRPNKGRQSKGLVGLHNVDMSEIQNGRSGSAKTKKAIREPTSREVLVMRELRKRRMSR